MKIVYQPIVELATGTTVGYEALSRFDGQSPDQAFAAAWRESEDQGTTLEMVAATKAVQGFIGKGEGYLSINVSARTIVASTRLLQAYAEAQVPWERLVVEITESDKVENYLPLYRPLKMLKERGARIAVDDVGTGYSGLYHISQLFPNILKLDRSLVRGIDTSPHLRAIVDAMVVYASGVNAEIVAEGVETEEERLWCCELGVRFGQGYLFGRPGLLPEAQPEQQ